MMRGFRSRTALRLHRPSVRPAARTSFTARVTSSTRASSRPRTAATRRRSAGRRFVLGAAAVAAAVKAPTGVPRAVASFSASSRDGTSRPRSIRLMVAFATSAASANPSWVSPAASRSRRRFVPIEPVFLGVFTPRSRLHVAVGCAHDQYADQVLDMITW